MYRIIGADGKEYGPITTEQVRQWVAEGRANAQTQVLLEGTTVWKPLSAFPELSAPASAAPPGAPPLPGAVPGPIYGAPHNLDAVNGPAIGLIIFAIIGLVFQVAGLFLSLIGTSIMATRGANQPFAQMFSGPVGMVVHLISLAVYGFIFAGAWKMKKLQSYGLAMTASILPMIPCLFPCCVIGLPLGIWAVVVLLKPEVKSAFH